jgi:hypothetical protein
MNKLTLITLLLTIPIAHASSPNKLNFGAGVESGVNLYNNKMNNESSLILYATQESPWSLGAYDFKISNTYALHVGSHGPSIEYSMGIGNDNRLNAYYSYGTAAHKEKVYHYNPVTETYTSTPASRIGFGLGYARKIKSINDIWFEGKIHFHSYPGLISIDNSSIVSIRCTKDFFSDPEGN